MKVAVSPLLPSGIYRTCVVEVISKAFVAETLPNEAQVEPSVEYCQLATSDVSVTFTTPSFVMLSVSSNPVSVFNVALTSPAVWSI